MLVVATLLINLHFHYKVKDKEVAKAAAIAATKAEADARAQKDAHEAQVIRDQQIAVSNKAVLEAKALLNAEIAESNRQTRIKVDAENYLNRYLTAHRPKKAGVKTIAIAVIDDSRNPNRTIEDALANHFKTNAIEIISSFFTQAFYSDGLFASVFAGSGDASKKLRLAEMLDAVGSWPLQSRLYES